MVEALLHCDCIRPARPGTRASNRLESRPHSNLAPVLLGTSGNYVILAELAILFQTGASMHGRALAQTAVVLEGNAVTQPAP